MTAEIVELPGDGGNSYMLRGEAAQDYADGAALRRLREALPEGWTLEAVFDPGDIETKPWHVEVEDDDIHSEGPRALEYATALSEAADKCREALE